MCVYDLNSDLMLNDTNFWTWREKIRIQASSSFYQVWDAGWLHHTSNNKGKGGTRAGFFHRWSVVTSYMWKHNETLVFHTSFAPGVFLGLLADSMTLISIAPLEFLPSGQMGLVCLDQIKDTWSLEFHRFIKKWFCFLFLAPGLSYFE